MGSAIVSESTLKGLCQPVASSHTLPNFAKALREHERDKR